VLQTIHIDSLLILSLISSFKHQARHRVSPQLAMCEMLRVAARDHAIPAIMRHEAKTFQKCGWISFWANDPFANRQ